MTPEVLRLIILASLLGLLAGGFFCLFWVGIWLQCVTRKASARGQSSCNSDAIVVIATIGLVATLVCSGLTWFLPDCLLDVICHAVLENP